VTSGVRCSLSLWFSRSFGFVFHDVPARCIMLDGGDPTEGAGLGRIFEVALDLLLGGSSKWSSQPEPTIASGGEDVERLRQQGWTSTKEAEGDVARDLNLEFLPSGVRGSRCGIEFCDQSVPSRVRSALTHACQLASTMFVASRMADASARTYSCVQHSSRTAMLGESSRLDIPEHHHEAEDHLGRASGQTHRASRVA
jgi:hypothetical protein